MRLKIEIQISFISELMEFSLAYQGGEKRVYKSEQWTNDQQNNYISAKK